MCSFLTGKSSASAVAGTSLGAHELSTHAETGCTGYYILRFTEGQQGAYKHFSNKKMTRQGGDSVGEEGSSNTCETPGLNPSITQNKDDKKEIGGREGRGWFKSVCHTSMKVSVWITNTQETPGVVVSA